MKKLITFSICLLTICIGCEDSDSNSSGMIEISGTQWKAIENPDDQKSFTFISGTEYIYMEQKNSFPGKFEFDGVKKGTLFETENDPGILFEIDGNILSVDQNDSIEGLETKYIKQ